MTYYPASTDAHLVHNAGCSEEEPTSCFIVQQRSHFLPSAGAAAIFSSGTSSLAKIPSGASLKGWSFTCETIKSSASSPSYFFKKSKSV